MDAITNEMGSLLAGELDGFKFVKSREHLVRFVDSGFQAIVIHATPTSVPEVIRLAAHAHVRLDEIESIYLPFHPYVEARFSKYHPTVVTNCESLLEDSSLIYGFENDVASKIDFARRYGIEFRDNIVPWLERYSSEEAVYEGLIDHDPQKWITSDRLTRYPVLMAIMAKRRDWEGFDRMAAEFAAYCNQKHAMVYKPLSEAMARLRESMS